MRILVVCHRVPYPPSRGGKIRPFNIIKHLQARHEVTVASLARSPEEARAAEGLAAHCSQVLLETISAPAALARMVARLPTTRPSSVGYFASPALARRIRQELSTTAYDLILVHCAFVAHYVAAVAGVPKILDFGDMDSAKWLAYARERRFPLSLGFGLEGLKLRRAEQQLAARFDLCTCTTRSELRTLQSYGVDVPLGWFPNGVDTEYFTPATAPYDPDRVCFVGRMDYYPNEQAVLDFCRVVLPLIRQRRPAVSLAVVGAAPSGRVRRLAEIPGVTVTGTVPDVRPWVQKSAVTVAPLKIARGTQNKILEAMAMGVPTVASGVAAGGIDAEPGRHLLTASSASEYADAVLQILGDANERARLSRAARERVLSHHSWAASMATLDDLVDRLMARRLPGAPIPKSDRR